MGSGDLSTDLALGIVPAASAGRAADCHATNPEAKVKVRHRSRPEADAEALDNDDPGLSSAADDQPAHQLDRLA